MGTNHSCYSKVGDSIQWLVAPATMVRVLQLSLLPMPEHFISPNRNPMFFSSHFPLSLLTARHPLTCLLSLWICLFWTFHIGGVTDCVLF
jgi:hypothetical protein